MTGTAEAIYLLSGQAVWRCRSGQRSVIPERLAAPAEMTEQDDEAQYRAEMVFDRWCGRLLSTPRDVVRLHQSIQFAWPHVPKGSDFCDFVWLQLLKLTCEDFYEWVRNYLQNVGSYRDRGSPGDSEAVNQGKQLLELLKRFGWHERMYLSGIDDMLPGLKSPLLADENGAIKVFEFENGELERFEHSRRLGSTRCSRPAFIRLAGTVQIFLSRSISGHRIPKTSPERAAVRMHSSSASAADASRFRSFETKAATSS
jgi:hypothetical protein